MNIRNQLIGAWSGILFMVVLGVGFGLFAGYIPPTPPSDNAQEVADFYRDNTQLLRTGIVLTMLGGALLVPWVSALAYQLSRQEGRPAIMARSQMLAGAMVAIIIVIPCMLWSAAAYRPERDPELVLLLSDVGWFFFILALSLPVVQMTSIAIAILGADNDTVFPRWVGYANGWFALLLMPGVLCTYFKDGIFAWDGLLGWWLTILTFFAFWTVNSVMLIKAIKQEASEHQAVPAA